MMLERMTQSEAKRHSNVRLTVIPTVVKGGRHLPNLAYR